MVLGFDFGMKYIGIATGQEVTKTATPLTSIKASNGIPNWDSIAELINIWRPSALIVGNPPANNASTQLMCQRIRKFSNRLHAKFNLPVHLVDENLSTWEAKQQLNMTTRYLDSKDLTKINAAAAMIILEQWLNM